MIYSDEEEIKMRFDDTQPEFIKGIVPEVVKKKN